MHYFADEEGVAVRPRVDPVDQCLGGGDISRSCDKVGDLLPREAAEANVAKPLGSCQVRQGAGERLGR